LIQAFFLVLGALIVVLYLLVFILSADRGSVSEEKGRVHVLVPTYNEAENIASCLESLTSMDDGGIEHTIHVIDDNSPDGTADIVENRFPEVILVRREDRTSKADALNTAVQNLEGDLFAVVDADCVVSENWLGKLIEPLMAGKGISTGSILVGNRGDSIWTRAQSCELAFLCHQLLKPVERVGMLYSINGNNFAFSRECWERAEGFDPSKLTEDTDFAVKSRLAGLDIEFVRARVFTRVPRSLGQLLRQRRRWALGWFQDLSIHSLLAGVLFISIFYYASIFFLAAFSVFSLIIAIIYYIELCITYKQAYGKFNPLNPLLYMFLWPILTTLIILTALPSALRGREKLSFEEHW
jgi:cellulose synthase/poly-beta-1,6-N-acetylglucosamine synthase-like glycosyltransferase